MTDIAAKIIDWRSQMSALQPHLEGLGGVIQVRLGNDSPGSAFARALRFTMKEEGWPFPWSCVQIDYENASTHYVSDIVRQIRKTAGLVVEASDISRQVTIDVGKDIKARGNVDIHDVNIAVESNQDSAVQFESYIQRLCDALRQELTSRRIALLFMNSHEYSRAELARMRRTIWDGALDGLVDLGLLLLDFSDAQRIPDSALWPPDPTLAIELPDKYDDGSRKAASDDLAQIAYEEGIVATLDEAKGFARGILMTSHNIRDMYASLALCLIAPKPNNDS